MHIWIIRIFLSINYQKHWQVIIIYTACSEFVIVYLCFSSHNIDRFLLNVAVAPHALLKGSFTSTTEGGENIADPLPLPDSAGLGFKLVTFQLIAVRAWVAAPSLNTHCEAIEHNETACTQALSDDMPSMHQPSLHPLLPYEMHLLYVIMLFEAHRRRDISSTSVFGQLIPSVHSTACGVIGS